MFVNNSTCLRDVVNNDKEFRNIRKLPEITYEGHVQDNDILVIGPVEVPDEYKSVEDFLAKVEFNVKFEVPNTGVDKYPKCVDQWYYCYVSWFSCLAQINDSYLYTVEVEYATSFSPNS